MTKGDKLIAFGVGIVVLGFVVLFPIISPYIKVPTGVAKWRADMPDDGTMLCSMAGQGFRLENDAFNFGAVRDKTFDAECKKRVK
jgi:hypothetical protein